MDFTFSRRSVFFLGRWIKLSAEEVCFGSQASSKLGNVTYQNNCRKEIFISCVKLVYKSSKFYCGSHLAPTNPKWGCSNLNNGYVNVVMSDLRKRIVFPKTRLVKYDGTDYGYALWYFLPGFSKTSNTISWCDFASPLCLISGQKLHLAHGEDIKGHFLTHNEGKLCVDVYGYSIY